MTTHFNDVGRYLGKRPDWAGDCIPICYGPGESSDFYTFDPKEVDCPDCLIALMAKEPPK